MRFRLLPREEEFFDLFTAVANRCQEAAVLLREQLTGRAERAAYCAESIKRLENEADEFTHEVVNRLDRTFITPIDREDEPDGGGHQPCFSTMDSRSFATSSASSMVVSRLS